MTELIGQLMNQVGVSEDQAKSGLGTILSFAQKQLSGSDFSQITNVIEGAQELMNAAPKSATQDSGNSLMGGLLGGLTSALGQNSSGGLQTIMGLVDKMDDLNLDGDTIAKFVPIITSFLKSKGVDAGGALGILTNFFK